MDTLVITCTVIQQLSFGHSKQPEMKRSYNISSTIEIHVEVFLLYSLYEWMKCLARSA